MLRAKKAKKKTNMSNRVRIQRLFLIGNGNKVMKLFRKKGFSIQILNRIRVNVSVRKAAKWTIILMMARCSADVSVGIRADVDIRADGALIERPADAGVVY